MRTRIPAMTLAAALLGAASTASAQGLEMCYDIVDLGGGVYEYDFTISTDAGWAPGMGWRWLIFGDERSVAAGGTGVSVINDFFVYPASFPVGPWEKIQGTGGGHNGPTFAKLNGAVLDYWIPATGSEVLTWRGDSTGRVLPGEMLFSTLAGTVGGAIAPNFTVATLGCAALCPCACDFDTSTGPRTCDIFDFLGFQNGFVAGDPCACDMDTSTGPATCDIFDFLAFQNAFVAGCP